MQTWNTPLESPNSMLNVVTTTISEGVAMLANCVCISERTYSNWIGCTGSHAFFISSNTTCSIFWMIRCSVCVKSRPSTRVWKRPSPPNRLSITANTRLGSNTNRHEPRSGFICTTFRLVGTTRLRMNSENLTIFTGATEISGLRRMKLKRPIRKRRAKRSLMISSVGMRPRTMRSCLPTLYGRTPSAGFSAAPASLSPETPFKSASTSSWERNSLVTARLLDHERREVHVLDAARRGFAGGEWGARFREQLRHQFLLARSRRELFGRLRGQEQQNPAADHRHLALQFLGCAAVNHLERDPE